MPFLKRLLYFLIILLTYNPSILYGQNTNNEIVVIANNYIKSSFNKDLNKLNINGNPNVILYNNDSLAYVVNLNPKGFIIISKNNSLSPIIAFSTESDFDYNINSKNSILDVIKLDISNRISEYNRIKDITESSSFPLATIDSILLEKYSKNRNYRNQLETNTITSKSYDTQFGPLLTSVWGGVNCYDFYSQPINVGNYYTPNNYSPGCVATATSIVMNHFEWPPTGVGYHTDYDVTGSSTGSYYANFGAAKYEWGRMLDKYMYVNTYPKHHKAMGLLAYHCAIAFDMDFEYDGSTSNLNRTPDALNDYFRYTSHYESSTWYSFWPRIRANIENGYPVTLAISKTNGEGHALVCDGYGQDEGLDKFYHLDFGWWGSWNGWYNIQGSWDASDYTIIDGAVLDILPIPLFDEAVFKENKFEFILPILVGKNLSWDSFKIWESINGGSYTLIETEFDSLNFHHSVSQNGLYRYKIQAKVNDGYYTNSISEPQEVLVERADSAFVSTEFDGSSSFFIRDNYQSHLDIKKQWTIESWFKVNSMNTPSDWDVILDREGVFSLYLIDAINGDYAVRFVSRDASGNILASLRTDSSELKLTFNEWNHIAVSYDSTYARLFINGALIYENNDVNFRLNYSTTALNVGARYWSSYGRYFSGEIDEIRLSDTVRYIQDFIPYRCMLFENDEYTRLLLHLDEGSGSALGDASSNFEDVNLRVSPNDVNWIINAQETPVVFSQELKATSYTDSIIINWSVETELDNIFYELYSSRNNIDWYLLAIVDGISDNSAESYSVTEQEPSLGENYYKLKIVNSGCKFFFSAIDSVFVKPTGNIKIYPNPASDILMIHGLRGLELGEVSIYDINGKYIEARWSSNSENSLIRELDISHLSIGMYFIKMEIDGVISYSKFIVGG